MCQHTSACVSIRATCRRTNAVACCVRSNNASTTARSLFFLSTHRDRDRDRDIDRDRDRDKNRDRDRDRDKDRDRDRDTNTPQDKSR